MALAGYVDQISRARIDGWVHDPDHPNKPVSVSIFVNGIHRGTFLATISRPDLMRAAGGPKTAECAFRFEFDPILSPFDEYRVEVVETWSGNRLPNGFMILPRPNPPEGEPELMPILVTSTGRSGSTMLMSEFARHPDVVVGDRYPFEIKQIGYHAAAFRALVADADRDRSTHPDTMLAQKMRHNIGANPYNLTGFFDLGTTGAHLRAFWQSRVPAEYAALFRTLIQEFYATLAAGQGKRSARYFCEKGDTDDAAIKGARLFFGAVKEIIVVRDPRDLLCSSIAFWKLTPEEAMIMLRTTFPRLIQVAHEAGPDTIVVRYEDLIRDPVPLRRAISDFVGLDPPLAPADEAVASSHRTSRDPASSVGRWRHDLTPAQIEACEKAFGPAMREFDYAFSRGEVRSLARPSPADENQPAGKSQIVAAEGNEAVATLFDRVGAVGSDGARSPMVLDVTFGEGSPGTPFLRAGWSGPERGMVWSCAHESQILLPAFRLEGDYRLHIAVSPFIHAGTLPVQNVAVLVNGIEAGTARLREISVLSVKIPSAAADPDAPVTLTLRFPDAISPDSVRGGGDKRMLGCALHRLALLRLDERLEAAARALGRPVRYVGAAVEPPPALTPEWRAAD